MHLAKSLLVFADEAVWGGDKQAEGRLKALITEPTLDFEPKGIDKMTPKSHINLIMASNEDRAVPASEDERRFFVLDIEKKPYMMHDFFAKLYAQMENGGYEAMMHDLLQWDCSARGESARRAADRRADQAETGNTWAGHGVLVQHAGQRVPAQ